MILICNWFYSRPLSTYSFHSCAHFKNIHPLLSMFDVVKMKPELQNLQHTRQLTEMISQVKSDQFVCWSSEHFFSAIQVVQQCVFPRAPNLNVELRSTWASSKTCFRTCEIISMERQISRYAKNELNIEIRGAGEGRCNKMATTHVLVSRIRLSIVCFLLAE